MSDLEAVPDPLHDEGNGDTAITAGSYVFSTIAG
jgi:hypothetical protein